MSNEVVKKYRKIIMYDYSSLLISAMNQKTFSRYNVKCVPTGGIWNVMRMFLKDYKTMGEGTTILLAIDSQINERKIKYPFYKSSRKNKVSSLMKKIISTQFELGNKFFPKIGIPMIEIPGLEADDIFYNIAGQNQTSNILVRTDDSDIQSLCVVNRNVILESMTSRGILENDPNMMINKIIKGDTTDDIPKLSITGKGEIEFMKFLFTSGQIPIIQKQITKDDLSKVFYAPNGMTVTLKEEGIEELMRNLYLVVPHMVNEVIPIERPQLNLDELYKFFCIFRLRSFGKSVFGKNPNYNYGELNIDTREVIDKFTEIYNDIDLEVIEHYKKMEYTDTAYTSKYVIKQTDTVHSNQNLKTGISWK